MPKITLFIDGKLIIDDNDLVGQLMSHGLSMQATMQTLMARASQTVQQMGKLVADTNQVLLDAVGAVKAAVDTYVADVTTLLTMTPPNVQGALDALTALRTEVDNADVAVKAALPPPVTPTP